MRLVVSFVLGVAGVAAVVFGLVGVAYALEANSPSNRAGNPLAQIGVFDGTVVAVLSFLAAIGLFFAAYRVGRTPRDRQR